jgi:hypothetical protein
LIWRLKTGDRWGRICHRCIGAGSAVPTAATWGQFDIGITQAYLRLSLAANRFQWTIGKIFAPNYLDAYPFFGMGYQSQSALDLLTLLAFGGAILQLGTLDIENTQLVVY